MRKIGIYFFLLSISTSCQKDFIVDITPTKISDKEVKVIINTNFPENTIFSITAERLFKRKNDPRTYGGTHFFSREYPVKNGQIEFSFKVDDNGWIKDYEEDRKMNPFDKELTEIDYESINDSLNISIFYDPIFESDENIRKIIGENGINLKGKGTIQLESEKLFRVSKKIYWKFEK